MSVAVGKTHSQLRRREEEEDEERVHEEREEEEEEREEWNERVNAAHVYM